MPIKELGPSDWYKKTFRPERCDLSIYLDDYYQYKDIITCIIEPDDNTNIDVLCEKCDKITLDDDLIF